MEIEKALVVRLSELYSLRWEAKVHQAQLVECTQKIDQYGNLPWANKEMLKNGRSEDDVERECEILLRGIFLHNVGLRHQRDILAEIERIEKIMFGNVDEREERQERVAQAQRDHEREMKIIDHEIARENRLAAEATAKVAATAQEQASQSIDSLLKGLQGNGEG